MNEFPAGSEELRIEVLPKIQVVWKTGPEPVPDFALIRVVGCLTQSDRAWMLTNTTEPVRSGNPQPTEDERRLAEQMPLGSETFGLMVSAAYSPERVKGHKVEVRGLLIRRPTRAESTSRRWRLSIPLAAADRPSFRSPRRRAARGPANSTAVVRRRSRAGKSGRVSGRRHPRLRYRQRTQIRQAHPNMAGRGRTAARERPRHRRERANAAFVHQHGQAACGVRSGYRENRLGENLRRPLLRSLRAVSRRPNDLRALHSAARSGT